jgi:hypothetical protein
MGNVKSQSYVSYIYSFVVLYSFISFTFFLQMKYIKAILCPQRITRQQQQPDLFRLFSSYPPPAAYLPPPAAPPFSSQPPSLPKSSHAAFGRQTFPFYLQFTPI